MVFSQISSFICVKTDKAPMSIIFETLIFPRFSAISLSSKRVKDLKLSFKTEAMEYISVKLFLIVPFLVLDVHAGVLPSFDETIIVFMFANLSEYRKVS